MNLNKIEMNGYTLYHIPNKKFKTFTVGAYFFRPLTKKGMLESSILSNLMMKYNKNYPTEQLLTRHLEEMYGMNLYVGFNRNALVNSMSFVIKSINDEYLENSEYDLLKESVDLLYDTINLPLFDEEKFNLEKELLIEDIDRVKDDKVQYANLKFIEAMYPHETCRHSIASMKDEALDVTLDDVKKEHQSFLKSKKVFYVIGDLDFNKIKETFKKISFNYVEDNKLEFLDYETKEITKVNEIIEKDLNNQSIVIMGYRSEIRENNDLYPAMFLLNNMLGGFFHSTLFQEIREKRSLAYTVHSEYSSKKGTFAISAGISSDKYDEFKNIVNEILTDYKNGFIDDETIDMTKKMLINAQYKIADQPSYGINIIIKEISGEVEKTLEEKIQSISNITKDELIEAANSLKLDTIFFLEGIK